MHFIRPATEFPQPAVAQGFEATSGPFRRRPPERRVGGSPLHGVKSLRLLTFLTFRKHMIKKSLIHAPRRSGYYSTAEVGLTITYAYGRNDQTQGGVSQVVFRPKIILHAYSIRWKLKGNSE